MSRNNWLSLSLKKIFCRAFPRVVDGKSLQETPGGTRRESAIDAVRHGRLLFNPLSDYDLTPVTVNWNHWNRLPMAVPWALCEALPMNAGFYPESS
jgi:hypothetical protein